MVYKDKDFGSAVSLGNSDENNKSDQFDSAGNTFNILGSNGWYHHDM